MLAPNVRNSDVRRRLASTWRLSNAAETAAPEERARRMTKRRPRLAKRRRRTRRRNIKLFCLADIIGLAEWGRVRSKWLGAEVARCPGKQGEAVPQQEGIQRKWNLRRGLS